RVVADAVGGDDERLLVTAGRVERRRGVREMVLDRDDRQLSLRLEGGEIDRRNLEVRRAIRAVHVAKEAEHLVDDGLALGRRKRDWLEVHELTQRPAVGVVRRERDRIELLHRELRLGEAILDR